jgi:hypothetical protein
MLNQLFAPPVELATFTWPSEFVADVSLFFAAIGIRVRQVQYGSMVMVVCR